MKKGEIYGFKDYRTRGLTTNSYFYIRGILDGDIICHRCIITKESEILINKSDLVDIERHGDDIEKIDIEEIVKEENYFKVNASVLFKGNLDGTIRNILSDNKMIIEIENEDTCDYEDVYVDIDDVSIVYPEFTFNDRRKFTPIN